MQLQTQRLDMPNAYVFKTSRSTEKITRNVLLQLKWQSLTGLGEASPTRFYFGQTQARIIATLKRMAPQLKVASPFQLEDLLCALEKRFPKAPAARAAVDIALHDLLGKALKIPLYALWGLNPAKTPCSSFTIGIDTLAVIQKKIAEAAPYPILKIKVGVPEDLEIMQEVRRLCPRKVLRVDANCGWSVNETIRKARKLEALGVEFIEQPIPPGDPVALKRIKQRIGLPLVTDESSVVPEDIPPLRGCVDGINIKIVKCGGLRRALQMIHTARSCGLKIMLGCMVESSLMITAAAHLTPLVDWADLDGGLLLARDPYLGVTFDVNAKLILPDGNGLGVMART